MSFITVGASTFKDGTSWNPGNTYLDRTNPANYTGIIGYVNVDIYTNVTGLFVGYFYGSGTSWTLRSYANIGSLLAGNRTVSGLSCAISVGDIIGIYNTGGGVSRNATGSTGVLSLAGTNPMWNYTTCTYNVDPTSTRISIAAYGPYYPSITMDTVTSQASTTMVANGTFIDPGYATITEFGFCYITGTTGTPTTSSYKKQADSLLPSRDGDPISATISGLSYNTSYRVRTYMINSAGYTGYSDTVYQTHTALQAAGVPIACNDVGIQIGQSSGNTLTMVTAARRTWLNKPTGPISMSDFYTKWYDY